MSNANDFTLGEIVKCGEEVKPCPFCGGKEIVIDKYEHKCEADRYRIFCTGCMAMIDPGWAQQKQTVIDMWNRRESRKENNNGN